MKSVVKLFIIAISVFQLNAQSYNIKWGALEKRSGRMLDIIPGNGDNFFTLRRTGGVILGSLQLSKHQDLSLITTGKISMKVNESMAIFEGTTYVYNHLMVFLSDKKDKKNQIFMQEYDEDLEPKGKAVKLGEYELPKGRSSGSFNIIHSNDRNFFGVIWETLGRKESKISYGFHIYDSKLNSVSEGEYELPYDSDLATVYSQHLSNTGDYFISILEYNKPEEKKIFNRQLEYKAFHISHVTPDGLDDFTLNLKGKRVEAMTMQSDNKHIFTITGIYGEDKKTGISGVFYLRANFDKQKIIDQGFQEFGKDFITQDWSDKQKKKAEIKEAKGKGEPQLYNYEMRDANVLKDGSIVASIEQYYVVTTTYTDPRTNSIRTTYTYYYNDIIAYKVGSNGSFDWLKKIEKQQVSTNDNGPFSSYARFIDGGKICFIFNDNIKNYNEDGEFIEMDKLNPANFGKKKNAVAKVELDINSGEILRNTFFTSKEINSLAIPKQFITDYVTKQLILYAVSGKKEKFGILNFKD